MLRIRPCVWTFVAVMTLAGPHLFAAEPVESRACSCGSASKGEQSPTSPISSTPRFGSATCGIDIAEACDGPAACGCGCGVPCCDRWSVLAEAVFLRRSDAGSNPLILDQNTGDTLLNANNLEFDHQAVPRVQLLYENCCCCWGFDIAFLGTDSWSTSGSGGDPESPVLVGPGVNFGSTAPGTVFQLDYSTNLYSAEFNLRRTWSDCWTWVAGFRWIELSDELSAYSTSPSLSPFYSVDADNNLYGLQLGADVALIRPSDFFRVDCIIRGGVFGNDADQVTRAPGLSEINGFVDHVRADGDDSSFMGEVGIRGVLQLTDRIAAFGGYQALWLDGLALAPEQIPVTNMATPGVARVNTKGDLYFHGATIGVQVTY